MYHIDEEWVLCFKSFFFKSPEGDAGAVEERGDTGGTAGLEGRGGLVPRALLPPNGVPTAPSQPWKLRPACALRATAPFSPFHFINGDYVWDIRGE